ncbi:MAG: hypothetical protein H6837_14145 [Planctomycetes bacterium]|nr:hypothetical protein [Planctomycetota bacterium]
MPTTRIAFLLAPLLTALATPAQTVRLVKEIRPGIAGSNPTGLTDFSGALLFAADDGTHGATLWRSDGTDPGTFMLSSTTSNAPGRPRNIFPFGAIALFSGTAQGSADEELWKTDGTPGGTVLVREFVPGSAGGHPQGFCQFHGKVYFQAYTGATGEELFVTDGTTAGTMLVKDLDPSVGGRGRPNSLTVCGDQLFFVAETAATGKELWVSDGTGAGTRMVKDIFPGKEPFLVAPTDLVCLDGKVYFAADDGTNGRELWVSDGTAPGTVMVKDIFPLAGSGQPAGMHVHRGKIYFSAIDTNQHGKELWVSDGTPAGTQLLLDIHPSASSDPMFFQSVGPTLFFRANGFIEHYELWKSDGTATGTIRIKDINPGGASWPADLTPVGERVFFSAQNGVPPQGNGNELWVSDGTALGTVLVKDIYPGSGFNSSYPKGLALSCGRVFFQARASDDNYELWVAELNGPSVQSIGLPCHPENPTLDATLPVLGSTLTVSGTGPANHSGFLAFSLPAGAFSLTGGCPIYFDLAHSVQASLGSTRNFALPVALPNDSSLEGVCVVGQTLWVRTVPGPVFSTSNGVSLALGR